MIRLERTTVHLVRHGQTISNLEDRMRGRRDVPLSDHGRLQARYTAEALRSEPLQAVYCSPLSRARDTAAAIAAARDLEPIVHESFHDMSFGDWEGELRSEIRLCWADLYRIYDETPERFQAPGGGSLWDLREASLEGMADLLRRHAGETVAVVSHMVTLHVLILALLGLGVEKYWNLRLGNCSISQVEHGPKGWEVIGLNRTDHLPELTGSTPI